MQSDDWYRQRKVATLPGTRVGPVVVLARTLEKAQAGKIKSVVISIEWEDTTHDLDWSVMKVSDLAMRKMCSEKFIQAEIFPSDATYRENAS